MSGGFYGVLVRFQNTDGTTSDLGVQFAKTTHGWQRVSRAMSAPKAFNAILVAAVYQDQTGTAVFDDLTLTAP